MQVKRSPWISGTTFDVKMAILFSPALGKLLSFGSESGLQTYSYKISIFLIKAFKKQMLIQFPNYKSIIKLYYLSP